MLYDNKMKFRTHKYIRYSGFCLCPKTGIKDDFWAYPCTVVEDRWIHCPECKQDMWVMALAEDAGITVWCEKCDKSVKPLGENHFYCPTCKQEKAIVWYKVKSISCGHNMAEKHQHIWTVEEGEVKA